MKNELIKLNYFREYLLVKKIVIYYFYFFSGEDFSIEKTTGIVRSLRSFDYETSPGAELKIRARNPGSPGSGSDTTLKVRCLQITSFN